MSHPAAPGLHELSPGTYAYLQPNWSWGHNNCGLICAADRATAMLVDTQFTLELTRTLLDSIAAARPETEITTVAITHANGDHSWGIQLLPSAEVISSARTAQEMPHEISPAAMSAMTQTTDPSSPMGRYMRTFFAEYDFSGIVITPPTLTFSDQLAVQVGDRTVELIEVGPAHTHGDVIVHVPDAQTLFAGDILFIGDHPVMWTGPIDNWITACDRIMATGATTIVPGHGPVTNRPAVIEFRSYLEQVAAYAHRQCTLGVPYHVAAERFPMDGFEGWGHPERLVVTIGMIYEQLGHGEPGGRQVLIDRMTHRYQALAP